MQYTITDDTYTSARQGRVKVLAGLQRVGVDDVDQTGSLPIEHGARRLGRHVSL